MVSSQNGPPTGLAADLAAARKRLRVRLEGSSGELVQFCRELGRIDSRNPPSDTTEMVAACRRMLDGVPRIALEEIVAEWPKVNLIARLPGGAPGPRLVMNGHLDTGPVVDPEEWTVPPFGGVIAAGRIYGRGIADMKAGIAAEVLAVRALSEVREHLRGELVLMLVTDEGTGARHGTQYVLEQRPELAGDAMISADAGSPAIARIGEKGFVWVEIEARGRAAGSAHPHRGANAIERLLPALQAILTVADTTMPLPAAARAAIEAASDRSEAHNGAGETHTLTHVTVNIGMVRGGERINNIPSRASASVDIRMPPGSSVAHVQSQIARALDGLPHITWRVLNSGEPTWTAPEETIVVAVARNAEAILGEPIGLSIRAGFSDSRFFRNRGIPTVVYGATAHNLNAPDEHVLISDLEVVFKVQALAAFDYLAAGAAPGA
jgi:succinyl-diaminopimelate desuccinylase